MNFRTYFKNVHETEIRMKTITVEVLKLWLFVRQSGLCCRDIQREGIRPHFKCNNKWVEKIGSEPWKHDEKIQPVPSVWQIRPISEQAQRDNFDGLKTQRIRQTLFVYHFDGKVSEN